MSVIKRVRSSKKTTWNGKEQVWDKDGKLKKYDGKWKDVEGDIQVYDTQWKTLSGDAELDIYDSNTPTFIGTVEDGIESAYEFKDWDGTVLKTGSVKDGGTPVPPADPTREPSGGYTYTFSGWDPTVGPITKSTEYIAQYEATAIEYTVSIAPDSSSFGSVDVSEVTANYGTAISTNANELTIGETTITATPESGYEFANWTCNGQSLPATVTSNMEIVANFQASTPTYVVDFVANDPDYGAVNPGQLSGVESGTAITVSNNTVTIGSFTSTATPESGYEFVNWTCNGSSVPATVTSNLTLTANFQAESPTSIPVQSLTPVVGDVDVAEGGTTTTTFGYSPSNANDFSNVTFFNNTQSYDGEISMTIDSFSSGTATATVTGVAAGEYEYNYTISGVGGILMGGEVTASPLPSSYQQVEYIQSTGGQARDSGPYINTGFAPSGTVGGDIKFRVIANSNRGEAYGLGVRGGSNGWRAGDDNGLYTSNGGFTYDPSTFALDTDIVATSSNYSMSTERTVYLFAQSEGNSGHADAQVRVYYCKMYSGANNATLVRDFVPCYRKSDDEIGMYDLVNDVFYTNAGTGTFIKGQDV